MNYPDIDSHNLEKIAKNMNDGTSLTRTIALSGTFTALPNEKCRCVELINNSNALIFQVNGVSPITCIDPSTTPVYCKNSNTIQVKGSGTLSYLLIK